jgi:hypothetical protein
MKNSDPPQNIITYITLMQQREGVVTVMYVMHFSRRTLR